MGQTASTEQRLEQYKKLTADINRLEAALVQLKNMRAEVAKVLLDENGKDQFYNIEGIGDRLFVATSKSGTCFLVKRGGKGRKKKLVEAPTEDVAASPPEDIAADLPKVEQLEIVAADLPKVEQLEIVAADLPKVEQLEIAPEAADLPKVEQLETVEQLQETPAKEPAKGSADLDLERALAELVPEK